MHQGRGPRLRRHDRRVSHRSNLAVRKNDTGSVVQSCRGSSFIQNVPVWPTGAGRLASTAGHLL